MSDAAMTTDSDVIAVVAGGGELPRMIVEKLDQLGKRYVVLSIAGFGPEGYRQFEIGNIGQAIEYMSERNVSKILFCGAIKRPSIFSLKLDKTGKSWLKHIGVRAFLGDDALIKAVRKLFEKEGIEIISPQSILNTLLTPRGVLTNVSPSESDLQDIARGIFVLNTMAKADVGQAVVVQEGVVLGIEAAEGTKNLIERCIDLKLSTARGGVLVKTAKTEQDRSIDMPTVGTETVLQVEYSNLAGIALGAGNSQIINYEATIRAANERGIFIIGI